MLQVGRHDAHATKMAARNVLLISHQFACIMLDFMGLQPCASTLQCDSSTVMA
jgi:hypothetical protein